jgi:hypothetical protein
MVHEAKDRWMKTSSHLWLVLPAMLWGGACGRDLVLTDRVAMTKEGRDLTSMRPIDVLETPSGELLPVRDMRWWADASTAYNKLAYPDPVAADEAHFAQATLKHAEGAGIDLGGTDWARMEFQTPVDSGTSDPPVPGGHGYGVTYLDSEMHWSSRTCIYHHIIAPKTPGGDVTTWLYNTATNRSEKGVEAYISYHAQRDMYFRVFDWAYADTDTSAFRLLMTYKDLSEYLASVESADGAYRQELHVVNCTFGAGTD